MGRLRATGAWLWDPEPPQDGSQDHLKLSSFIHWALAAQEGHQLAPRPPAGPQTPSRLGVEPGTDLRPLSSRAFVPLVPWLGQSSPT